MSRWSFVNVAELVPSAAIDAAPGQSEPPLADAAWLLGEKIELSGGATTVGAFLQSCDTDRFRRDEVRQGRCRPPLAAASP